MIKGRNQHVMPCADGWCVIDETNQALVHHFEAKDEAMAYAKRQAKTCESDVLLHDTPSGTNAVSAVQLPQRQFLPGETLRDISTPAPETREGDLPGDRAGNPVGSSVGTSPYSFEI